MERRISDETALEAISELLDGKVWSPNTLDEIAGYVRLSGREVRDSEDVPGTCRECGRECGSLVPPNPCCQR